MLYNYGMNCDCGKFVQASFERLKDYRATLCLKLDQVSRDVIKEAYQGEKHWHKKLTKSHYNYCLGNWFPVLA